MCFLVLTCKHKKFIGRIFRHSHLGENPQKHDQTCISIVIKILLKSELSEEDAVNVHIWAAVERSEVTRKERS